MTLNSLNQMSLIDTFAIEAGENGRIIGLFTVADLDLTVEEGNNLTTEDRELIRDILMECLNWQEAIDEAVSLWRTVSREEDEDE